MHLLSGFFALNRRLSLAVETRLPEDFKRHLHTLYKYQVAEMLNGRPGQVVLDVGGGKDCPFLSYVDDPQAQLIIALDCSEEELRRNRKLDKRIVGDAAAYGFPVRDRLADLVVSRSVVEHIRDNAAFFKNCTQALRPGGTMIHAFPGRFAPFALINQVLPNWLVRRLIAYLLPDWVEGGNFGFVAFYDRCYYSAVEELICDNDLQNVRYLFTYYQSIYFSSFFPLFCLMVVYDLIAWRYGIRNMASGILVIAERSPEGPDWADTAPVEGNALATSAVSEGRSESRQGVKVAKTRALSGNSVINMDACQWPKSARKDGPKAFWLSDLACRRQAASQS